jgi:hypothetical protein
MWKVTGRHDAVNQHHANAMVGSCGSADIRCFARSAKADTTTVVTTKTDALLGRQQG